MSTSSQLSDREARTSKSDSYNDAPSLRNTARGSHMNSPVENANSPNGERTTPTPPGKHNVDVKPELSREQRSTEELFRRRKRDSRPYQDLLDDMISDDKAEDDFDGFDSLQSSFIAGSFWEAQEKENLFRNLPIVGIDDLPQLSRAVRSKSVVEIKAYLSLLEYEARALSDREDIAGTQTSVDIPASVEVGEVVEDLLDKFAEKQRDDSWLADQEEEANQYEDWLIQDPAPPPPLESTPTMDSELLCAATLLQLSETVFMNGPVEEEANWRCFIDPNLGIYSPAIFRSAFGDLHNLVVLMLRQIVRAAIIQTEFRLRAKLDTGKREVKVADVLVAADLLGLQADRRRYWACLPRRCGVTVYTYSDRYNDGRPTTKNGVPLLYEEVEAELGLPLEDIALPQGTTPTDMSEDDTAERSGAPTFSDDNDDIQKWEEFDSDNENAHLSTEDMDAERESGAMFTKFDAASGEDSDVKPLPASKKQKRKAGFLPLDCDSETDDIDDESHDDEHLDVHDQHRSQEEEQRLLALLLNRPPQLSEFTSVTQHPSRKKAKHDDISKSYPSSSSPNWRTDVGYVAEWELSSQPRELGVSRLPTRELKDGKARFAMSASHLAG